MDSSKWLTALLLLLQLGCVLAFDKVLEKNRLDGQDTHDIDIYVEKKISYLHAKIDLKPTIVGLISLDRFTTKLEKGAGQADSLNAVLSKNLRAREVRITKKVERITGKKYTGHVDKRSIEVIGDLISDLFGNPGPADMKKINANFLALREALRRTSDNTGTNHADIDGNRHSIEKQNVELKSLNTLVIRNQNTLNNVNENLAGIQMFMEVNTFADALESIVDSILEAKSDGQKGYCNDRVLDKEFLVEKLQALESNKAGLAPIFGSWEWREYYKHVMCTIALVEESVWLTIRIPLVMKSEKMARVIPSPTLRQGLSKLEGYGITPILFKELTNDKYTVLTQTSLDMCNILGNTRTCGIRNIKFQIDTDTVIAAEFAHNKFILVSSDETSIKLMERCQTVFSEHSISLDSAIYVPNNCSYVSKSLNIDVRESDNFVTQELGLATIDKFEITKIKSNHINVTKMLIADIANKTIDSSFDLNRKIIEERINSIDTKHTSLWESYAVEKWSIVGIIVLVVLAVVISKIVLCRKMRNIQLTGNQRLLKAGNDIELKLIETKAEALTLAQKQIEIAEAKISARMASSELPIEAACKEHPYEEVEKSQNESNDREKKKEISFSSPRKYCQF